MPALLVTGLILLAAPAGADPAAQVTDARGDANGLTTPYPRGGLVGSVEEQLFPEDPLGYGTSTGPASHAPADLLAVGFETTHEAVPVGEDGIDYRVTGLRVHVTTSGAPAALGTMTSYVVRALADNQTAQCTIFFEGVFPGGSTAPYMRLQLGNAIDGCAAVTTNFSGPALRLEPDATGLRLEVPLSALGEDSLYLEEGAVLFLPQAFVEVASFATRLDTTPRGSSFTIGSDMPADVPCTLGCPAE